jgi:hypothetical protein
VTAPPARSPGPGLIAVALRLAALLALVLALTWVSHQVRDALETGMLDLSGPGMRQTVLLATLAYVVLLALPFVPGVEVGLALLACFGATVAPLVYAATVAALMLAYGAGCALPAERLAAALSALRLRRAADLVARAAPLPRSERLAMLLDGAPPRLLALAVRHRYVALALAVNLPGNAVAGGGGGILLMAGLSGLFAPMPTLMALALAVAPVPLAVLLMGG